MKSTDIPDAIWQHFKIPIPKREYIFHDKRKWRIDYAIMETNKAGELKNIAIEIEGGVWQQGRHTRGSGFVKDMEKYNSLTEYGFQLLRYQPNRIDFEQIKRVFEEVYV